MAKKRIIDNEIQSIEQPWSGEDSQGRWGYDKLRVEEFIKGQINLLFESEGMKFGYAQQTGNLIMFYDNNNDMRLLLTLTIGTGKIYNINIECSLDKTFYVLADLTQQLMSISATTTESEFGSSQVDVVPEKHLYTVAFKIGNEYVDRISGLIDEEGTATFDIMTYLHQGANYIRLTVEGGDTKHVKTTTFTANVTTLMLNVNHDWSQVWRRGLNYKIKNIKFAGAMAKTLYILINDETPITVSYSSSVSYVNTYTSYDIPSQYFPLSQNGLCKIRLWMSALNISTPVTEYNIICSVEGDSTPVVTINNIRKAVNFTQSTIFSYSCIYTDNINVAMIANIGGYEYEITSGEQIQNISSETKYDFYYSFELDTGANETATGDLDITITPCYGSAQGIQVYEVTQFDNTYSYLSTAGAGFYMNAATRSNLQSNKEYIVNEAYGSIENNPFANRYSTTLNEMQFFNDMWGVDQNGYNALIVPAGSSVLVNDFNPLGIFSQCNEGMTIEFMLKSSYPSEYTEPILTIASGSQNEMGIIVYPTKVVVLKDSANREGYQSVDFSENSITHFTITLIKNYGGNENKNLASIFINGISNVNFEFSGINTFGNGSLIIGQLNTDVYLYKMRVYTFPLDSHLVFNNFLNSIFDGVEFNKNSLYSANNILEGDYVDYDKVKDAGFNTMIVEIPSNNIKDLPGYPKDKGYSYNECKFKFEYSDNPEWNVIVGNIELSGQGTTSMSYYRWNLRGKTSNSTTWTYFDETPMQTGKSGYFIKNGSRGLVDRITAKKNYASSMQGHKMGLTGLYNDLFKQIGLGSHLPDSSYQVAVYLYPFVGFFHDNQNDSYQYIGLYTAGPDKSSKVTFGYSNQYPNLLSLEGPNHNPRGTRFLHPWVDVDYDEDQETLTFGGEEGWDCSYVNASNKLNILAVYTNEWKPAYNVVFENSPYIVSALEMITSLNDEQITSVSDLCDEQNISKIFNGSTNGYSNQLLCFYDNEYELYFYRRKTGRFEKLGDIDQSLEHNVVNNLYSGGYLNTQSPTTSQIVSARVSRFKEISGNYWDMDQTLYHYCFCILFAVTDNFAKNSYPFKFRGYNEDIPSGENINTKRWGWRQDDVDTSFLTDNNGRNTKKYSVEHGDKAGNSEIFQGGNSVLWTLIKDYYKDEQRSMMQSITQAASDIATDLNISGSGLHDTVFNVIDYYCWKHSAKYFSLTLYESDKDWAYIEPWLIQGKDIPNTSNQYPSVYNGVEPLTQSIGDLYQAEKQWVERRIAYIFSKYYIGAFYGDIHGYNDMSFTLADSYTFNVTPAIDLYPSYAVGSTTYSGQRTMAGLQCTLNIQDVDASTTNYFKGIDWLESLGDLSGMELTTRGGEEQGHITFEVKGTRMKNLKIGDQNPQNVKFNATALSIISPSLLDIDARNTSTISENVNLKNCPRLRKALFDGCGATEFDLPIYGKLTEVSFPNNCGSVFMHQLALLLENKLQLPDYDEISKLYICNCDLIDPIKITNDILKTNNNILEYLGLTFRNTVYVDDIDDFERIINHSWSGRYIYSNGQGVIQAGQPFIQGTVDLTQALVSTSILDEMNIVGSPVVSGTTRTVLSDKYGTNLNLVYDVDNTYISFDDENVESICLNEWDNDEDGKLRLNEAESVNSISYDVFSGNSQITTFNELKYFTNLLSILSLGDSLAGNPTTGAFSNCTNLTEITIPENVSTLGEAIFYNCTNLEEITWLSDKVHKNQYPNGLYRWYGCSKLKRINISSLKQWCGNNLGEVTNYLVQSPFYGSKDDQNDPGGHLYMNGQKIQGLVVLDFDIGMGVFAYCNDITSAVMTKNVHNILTWGLSGSNISQIFYEGNLSEWININKNGSAYVITSKDYDLYLDNQNSLPIQDVVIPTTKTEVPNCCFQGCKSIKSVTIPQSVRTIRMRAFDCPELNTIIINSTEPPVLETRGIISSSQDLLIYVPYGCSNAYKNAENWSNFENVIVELDLNGNIPS